MKILTRRWWLAAAAAVAVAGSTVGAVVASAGTNAAPATPGGLGQTSGLLPRTHLTEESAIQVNLSKETVRLPLYPGTAHGKKVWYVLLDASDAGQPIVYLSTDAGQPLTAVLERSTYVPALNNAAFNGGDDFLGSARERLFGFINGQTGAHNPQAQGFVHLIKDGFAAQDASAGNTAMINALRHGGDLLNVFGDFPTLKDPRHADAYSPLWDAQLGLWTPKAVTEGLNTRQIDENVVFNLADQRPDLLTGVNPATGQPAPYGSAGVDINCAVIGFTIDAPTANLAAPVPNSQFPPR